MPPRYVKTIREEIFYEYAKLISRRVFDGKPNRGFITDRFKALRDGKATMSDTMREWQREQEEPKVCVYCGSEGPLHSDHLISRSRGGSSGADNMVLACETCNTSRGDKGVFEWLGLKNKDNLHRLVAGKYLKQLFAMHEAAGTLDVNAGNLDVLCGRCSLGLVCDEWDTVGKLTCFCLESVLSRPH